MIGAFGRFEYALADRYRIERELGRGGMATVYLARDVVRSRPVAIKLMHPASDADRFLSEIRLTAGLTHPGIVPLYESDAVDGMPYFVMPYLGGETLRHRLRREGALAVEDAVGIAEQLASALDYAHRQGIVHRDVKPENILLAPSGDADGSERAVLLDLGVAHAVATPDDQRLTQTGASPGTPLYMAPEQLEGGRDVDPRADQYALAAVLYEMLVGEPPFVGANAHLRKLALAAPSVREARPRVPDALAAAVARGLERMPADRFRSCAELCEALRRSEAVEGDRPSPRPSPAPRFGTGALAGLALVVALGGVASLMAIRPVRNYVRCAFTCARLDPNRYAIFPFQHLGGGDPGLLADVQLNEAFGRWRDLDAVEQYQARAAWAQRDTASFGADDGVEAAWGLLAGRYVLGSVAHLGPRMTVTASLHDATRGGRLVARASVTIAPDDDATPSFQALADSLLFSDRRTARPVEIGGTRSVEAQRAYLRAHDAVAGWDLRGADSLFAAAARLDDSFAKAQLWLAQVRSWRGDAPALWAEHARRAADRGAHLSAHERALASALHHMSRDSLPAACAVYDSLYTADSLSFEASFGRGECRRRDRVVVRDARSPSEWAFRSSSHSAVQAYRRAFELIPSSNYAFRDRSFERLRLLLKLRGSDLRMGRPLPPDTGVFGANVAWDAEGDTLAVVPYRVSDPRFSRYPPSMATALARNREAFQSIARAWAAAFPESPDAAEAVATSLELTGDERAVEELRRARRLSRDSLQRARLMANEVWLRIRFGAPDVQAMGAARAVADTLLRDAQSYPATAAPWLAGAAALVGRANLAAALAQARRDTVHVSGGPELVVIPAPAAAAVAAYSVRAAVGTPDSLRAAERRVVEMLQRAVPAASRSRVLTWLLRDKARLAYFSTRSIPPDVTPGGDPVMAAQLALRARDSVRAAGALAAAQEQRRGYPLGELTADTRLLEADLLAATGRTREAAAWLDDWLGAARFVSGSQVSDVWRTVPLVRAMLFRAELAARLGDADGAERWGAAVAELWRAADDDLRRQVRITRLAGSRRPQ